MNIWIVSLFDPTPKDNTRPMRYMSIAQAGVSLGHHITHISCTFRHSTKVQRFPETNIVEVSEHYRMVYVHSFPYKQNVSLRRILSHNKFTGNLLELLPKLGKPDAILIAMPPLITADKLGRWAKKNGIPFYLDIIDPWPDVFSILVPKWVLPFLKIGLIPFYAQLKRILNNVSGVVAISGQYIKWVKGFGINIPKAATFLPSVPVDEVQAKIERYKAASSRPLNDKLRCIYAGNLGVAYDIPCILEASKIIESKYPGMVEFVFAGTGHYEEEIKSLSKEIESIRYCGRLDYEHLLMEYANADLGLAQYSSGATQSVTYKFFDYLSSGLPILNSLPTEMAELIEANDLGMNNEPGNAGALAANIEMFLNNRFLLDQHKKNAISFAFENGNNDTVYKRLINFITDNH
ncbi:MAG: glycosyltransferase family 4 protein [Chitinophagaceae bacterium]|jgi:glycosyltransferase involved in cell wall biosynthesis|nr:glycosyltransferase family 4 protein [Chitinophagaceae bacterium]